MCPLENGILSSSIYILTHAINDSQSHIPKTPIDRDPSTSYRGRFKNIHKSRSFARIKLQDLQELHHSNTKTI